MSPEWQSYYNWVEGEYRAMDLEHLWKEKSDLEEMIEQGRAAALLASAAENISKKYDNFLYDANFDGAAYEAERIIERLDTKLQLVEEAIENCSPEEKRAYYGEEFM